MASHMEINSIVYCGSDENHIKIIKELASNNVKRSLFYRKDIWTTAECESPYLIEQLQEVKTTWHPALV